MRLIVALCILISSLSALERPSDNKLKTLYNRLDPTSAAQHLAFYELYPDHPRGQQALHEAWMLLSGSEILYSAPRLEHLSSAIQAVISLINKSTSPHAPGLSDKELAIIEKLAAKLPHQRLKGHLAQTEEEVIQLAPAEVDLARGIFISQFGSNMFQIRLYEAIIDLMALQIMARLPHRSTPEAKIQAMNHFVFEEMRFRFPPHSMYAKDIDIYTLLSSVIDSHRGVCLGVSILYLCLAQRLDLPLEVITPPGHIYVRYYTPEKVINIETTARGIHVDSEEYLGIHTKALQMRNIKEVIGLAYINQAAVYWRREDYAQALNHYQKAESYLPDDSQLKELMGYTHLILGDEEKGRQLLLQIKDHIPEHAISKETLPEDYLNGKVDAEGLKAIFKSTEDDRQSILVKKQLLEEAVARFPEFRTGLLQLAATWLQLHRMGESLEILKRYHTLNPDDPEANYYLTMLYAERMDYNKAWEHFHQMEAILLAQYYQPKVLKETRRQLLLSCPE